MAPGLGCGWWFQGIPRMCCSNWSKHQLIVYSTSWHVGLAAITRLGDTQHMQEATAFYCIFAVWLEPETADGWDLAFGGVEESVLWLGAIMSQP